MNKKAIFERLERITDFREFMIFYIIILGAIGMTYAVPEFLAGQNLSAILLALSDQSIIAIGMTLLLVSGGFDLSVGSVVALSGAVTAIWLNDGMSVPAAIGLGLGTGTLIGLINGLVIAELGINPFITTLGMMSLARGMLMVVTDGQNISGLPESFTVIGQGSFIGIQYPIIISIALVILGDFMLRRSRFFRQNYYIGGNEKAAILSGINVKRMKIFNYVLTGFLAALAGIIITARLGSASTSAGKGLELRVISAVIIGGASLKGGVGTIAGSFLGALLLAIIVSSINLLGVDLNWIDFVLGATLLLAVMADTYSMKQKQKQKHKNGTGRGRVSKGAGVLALVIAGTMGMAGPAAAQGPLDVPGTPPAGWWQDPCTNYEPPAKGIGRKQANVIVISYNPRIESKGGRKLTEVWNWNDPFALTERVIESIREASGGYINYHIVKTVEVDGCPPWRSGFRYDDEGIMEVLKTHKWAEGDGTSYARVFEENGVNRKFVEEFNVTEVWLWGAPGFHWDEYAMFIPDRSKRLPPTENPWFYRPYDIPDLGRTLWVMGWSYERGLDCALESYAHRCEGILSLALANGVWDLKRAGKDPWNTWIMCDMDFPGKSGCGNVHVPPNGQAGYDYGNTRTVKSACADWTAWPRVTGKMVEVDGTQWNRDHARYLVWWMGHFPKNPGRTAWGWNNWWVYVANFDCRLDDYRPPALKSDKK